MIAVFLANGAEALLIVLIEVTALHAVARVFVVAVSFADFLAPDEVMLMPGLKPLGQYRIVHFMEDTFCLRVQIREGSYGFLEVGLAVNS